MKKKIVFVSLIIVLVIGTICIRGIFSNPKIEVGVRDLKTYDKEQLPNFTITIGNPNAKDPLVITKEDIIEKNVVAYEFKGSIDNNWKIVENDYVGIRLTDLFEAYDVTYKDLDIDFYELESYNVKYNKDEINEDMFLIFSKDGEHIGNIEPIAMMSFRHKWNRSLADINYIYIYEEPKEKAPAPEE